MGLLEKAWKPLGQIVLGGGRDTGRGVQRQRILREVGPVAPLTYYTISTIFVKVNLSILVSTRWRRGGSAALKPVRNPGSRDVQTSASRDSAAREEVGSRRDSAGP